MANADCIVLMGGNMAEAHPVGFQWVSEAITRGARVIHIDPRFTRTSAVANKHVPIRAGSDVVLLGALINHMISNELYFRDYVVAYTNAATLITARGCCSVSSRTGSPASSTSYCQDERS